MGSAWVSTSNINDAGKEVLSFLALHQATVCNPWFEKRDIYKERWQHLMFKQWKLRQFRELEVERDRGVCVDVTAKRRAGCNTITT